MVNKNLGHATAYAYAVAGGYTGTEAEFTALLGDIAKSLEDIAHLRVVIHTLPEGSEATAEYKDGVLTLGVPSGPRGEQGEPGPTGPQGPAGQTGERGETGNGIESTTLNSDYTLTIRFTDGTEYTTESIRGAQGEPGPQGVQGPKGDTGETGATGERGATGNGIASTTLNSDYTLTIVFTDGTEYTTGSIRGVQGPEGPQGVQGPTGPQGPRGADYVLTSQDKQDIADIVIGELPTWTGGSY